MNSIIIHICGDPGCGKTYLSKKIKQKYKNKIIIKELEDLRDEFIEVFYKDKEWFYIDEIEYQKYINSFINKQKKPIIFIGFNDNLIYGKNKKLYYKLHSKHNFYIDSDIKLITKQKCLRLLNEIQTDKNAMNDLVNNNELFVKQFTKVVKTECNIKETIKLNDKWKKIYTLKNYTFMTKQHIYNTIKNLLNKYL